MRNYVGYVVDCGCLENGFALVCSVDVLGLEGRTLIEVFAMSSMLMDFNDKNSLIKAPKTLQYFQPRKCFIAV